MRRLLDRTQTVRNRAAVCLQSIVKATPHGSGGGGGGGGTAGGGGDAAEQGSAGR